MAEPTVEKVKLKTTPNKIDHLAKFKFQKKSLNTSFSHFPNILLQGKFCKNEYTYVEIVQYCTKKNI